MNASFMKIQNLQKFSPANLWSLWCLNSTLYDIVRMWVAHYPKLLDGDSSERLHVYLLSPQMMDRPMHFNV